MNALFIKVTVMHYLLKEQSLFIKVTVMHYLLK